MFAHISMYVSIGLLLQAEILGGDAFRGQADVKPPAKTRAPFEC